MLSKYQKLWCFLFPKVIMIYKASLFCLFKNTTNNFSILAAIPSAQGTVCLTSSRKTSHSRVTHERETSYGINDFKGTGWT